MTGRQTNAKVVLHADDVGMCHGANTAFAELSALGTCSAGSVMVPCPAFREMAEIAAESGALDLGVHLTLTSEKRDYKWGPVSSSSPSAGMTDPDGHFWPDVATVRQHAVPEAVEIELRAQIDTALAAGIDVTHLDDHMGVVLIPELCDTYIQLGIDYALPILLTPSLSAYGPIHNLVGVNDEPYAACVERARRLGFLIFDRVLETPWDRAEPIEPAYRDMLATAGDGWTYCAFHFNAPGEVEAIEPETCRYRTEEYALFREPGFRDWLNAQPFRIVGMRALRDDTRAAWQDAGQQRNVAS